jgi:membrane-bound serine protease (ClpP class)
MRALAEQRGRNAEWYERSVRESVSATADEAFELGVIDFIAKNRTELLEKLDGREVTLVDDVTKSLNLKGAGIVEIPMSLRDRLLHQLANPNLAYIFLLLGFYGLYFELSNPGSIFPGVVGGILLLLGLFALQMMPVNYVGVLLIAFAMLLFLVEIKVPSHGLLTIGGIVALVLGSLMLFDTTDRLYRVSWSVLVPAVGVTVAFFLFAVGMGIRAQRKQPATGREGLVGLVGEVTEPLEPDGRVFVEGELWFASADEPIETGETIQVVAVHGMKLKVRRRSS